MSTESEYPAIYGMESCDEIVNDVDRATIQFFSWNNGHSLYAINDNCYQCEKTYVASNSSCASLYTVYKWKLYVLASDDNEVDRLDYTFGEQGVYHVNLEPGSNKIKIDEITEPINSMYPFWVLMSLILTVMIVAFSYSFINKLIHGSVDDKEVTSPLIDQSSDTFAREDDKIYSYTDQGRNISISGSKPVKERLKSLDAFRGLSLTAMIVVNYGGFSYWFLQHAPWNGLTFADLLFPWFMLIMGISTSISFKSLVENYTSDQSLNSWWHKVVRRSVILFSLGLFLADGYNYKGWRIPGVLQYFAWSYFVTCSTVLLCIKFTAPRYKYFKQYDTGNSNNSQSILAGLPRIMLCYSYEWIIQSSILLIYLCICLLAKAPNCPRGYNGPGGISHYKDAANDCTGGIHKHIDYKLLGYSMIYHSPTCRNMYDCVAYDPEGVLGSFSACTLTYIGLMAGRIISNFTDHRQRMIRFAICGCFLSFLSGILCGFSQNDGIIPINKNLWSTSFIFVTSGTGLLVFCLCYYLIDVKKYWTGAPVSYLGMNSILIYVGHELLAEYMPFSYKIYEQPLTHTHKIQQNMLGISCWVLIAFYLYKIKFFVNI